MVEAPSLIRSVEGFCIFSGIGLGRSMALWGTVWRCMALWDAVCSVRNATDIGIRLIFLRVMLALQLYKGLAVSVS